MCVNKIKKKKKKSANTNKRYLFICNFFRNLFFLLYFILSLVLCGGIRGSSFFFYLEIVRWRRNRKQKVKVIQGNIYYIILFRKIWIKSKRFSLIFILLNSNWFLMKIGTYFYCYYYVLRPISVALKIYFMFSNSLKVIVWV